MVGCEWGDALLMVQDRNYGDDEEVGGKRGGKRRLGWPGAHGMSRTC